MTDRNVKLVIGGVGVAFVAVCVAIVVALRGENQPTIAAPLADAAPAPAVATPPDAAAPLVVNLTPAQAAIAKRKQAEQSARNLERGRRHLRLLSEEMRKRGSSQSFDVGINPEIVLFDGLCTRELLDDLARRMGPSFRGFGFTKIECLDLSAPL